jgi:hypothetical protein
MMMVQEDRKIEYLLRSLEVEALSFSTRFINDPLVRQKYMRNIKALSHEYQWKVQNGSLSIKKAAEQVNMIRNELLKFHRKSLSDLGRAYSEKMKKEGSSMTELTERYAKEKFKLPFNKLDVPQQNKVYLEIIESAGRDKLEATVLARRLSPLGRAIMFVTVGVIVYNVFTAEDKLMAVAEEGAELGGGLIGGTAVGYFAGLACGPASPVCVTIGVFIGGALGASGARAWFHWVP